MSRRKIVSNLRSKVDSETKFDELQPSSQQPPRERKIDPYLKDIENEAASAADAVNKLIALKKKAELSIAVKAGKGVNARTMLHVINHLFQAHAAIKNGQPDWLITDPADAIIHIANAIMSSEKVNTQLDITDPITKWIHTFTSIGVIVLESLYHLNNEAAKQEQTGDDKPDINEIVKQKLIEKEEKEKNDNDTNTDN